MCIYLKFGKLKDLTENPNNNTKKINTRYWSGTKL